MLHKLLRVKFWICLRVMILKRWKAIKLIMYQNLYLNILSSIMGVKLLLGINCCRKYQKLENIQTKVFKPYLITLLFKKKNLNSNKTWGCKLDSTFWSKKKNRDSFISINEPNLLHHTLHINNNNNISNHIFRYLNSKAAPF